jgi:hypothetical protein
MRTTAASVIILNVHHSLKADMDKICSGQPQFDTLPYRINSFDATATMPA